MKDYLVKETIHLESGEHLTPSRHGPVLRAAPGFVDPIIKLRCEDPLAAEKEIQGVLVEDLTLVVNPGGVGIVHAADVPGSNPRSVVYQRVRVEGDGGTGALIANAEGGAFRDCKFIRLVAGVAVGGLAAGLRFDACDFRHNSMAVATGGSKPSSEWLWSRCHFESNTSVGVMLHNVRGWAFDTCKWEGNAGHVVVVWTSTDGALRPDGHAFRSCAFNATTNGQPGIDVRAGNDLLFEWLSASPNLATVLRFAPGVGYRSMILGRAFGQDRVRIEGADPQRVTWWPAA